MKRFTRMTALLLMLIVSISGMAQEKIRVACVGNSITYGSGIKNRSVDSYPAQLQRLLGDEYEVVNFGIGGRTGLTKGDRPYVKEKIYKEALNFNPHCVIIKFGTNDTKPQNWVHKDEFAGDIEALGKSFENLPTNPEIYLCYPAKAYKEQWGIRDSVIVNEVIPIIKKVAKKNKWKTIDLHKATDKMGEHFPDAIHPDPIAAGVMAKKIYKKIK
ncbi:MAG: hypothetical protein IJY78_00660 [Bacteroidaceae bacterium]|nr:hypothetical protein [Bacteroidaceae bacterium]